MTVTQFEALLKQYGDSVFGFCCHLTGDRMQAEDLYQESVLKAFSQLERMRCEGDEAYLTARNYILGITVRIHKNQQRKHSTHEQPTSPEDMLTIRSEHDVAAEAEQQEIKSLVRVLAEALPEKLRIVTYLYYFIEMRTEEIAQMLHIPKGTVKSRLSRAREAIKKELEEHGYEGL